MTTTTPTEADTCCKYVLPKLYSAGWTDEQISEQKSFTCQMNLLLHGLYIPR